ncbi:uncharacterized protein LOC131345432 isoform X2 [Hemibagrus wyckioides]|uniref:uncharacterized protein LOC131345432 isoform X2 n=1 Tax=Hemibagrus wyckioides TaxID=337641 RepID=UPI00266D5D52|nr:uncharacterized protein LOC131345432 isoform X2 [Hemibagrus wyckioides]
MSVHGKKTSLSITAVNVSDTGLYYCSFIQQAEMKFCKSVYLQVKGGNETLVNDMNKAADRGCLNVFFMLTVVFGAVSMILLSMLIFIIQKYRKKETGVNAKVYEDQESESLNYAALQLSNQKSKRKGKHDALEYQYVIYSLVRQEKVTHTLQYLYTAVTPGINFPEYTDAGLVDGEPFVYYDSNIKKYIPKTEWIKMIIDDPDYWTSGTQIQNAQQETYKADVITLMQRFNQTGGFHTLQRMYGCEIDDDGTIRGYEQLGYDGEDFISLDLEHVTWTAAKPQAVISKNKLDTEGAAPFEKFYLENICIEWLNKYVSHGRETLERKVRPEVSIFHKHSSPDVVCHTTGFYPKEVVITWKKDGEVMLEDVELRETLPNQDGSFQKRSILKVSAEELQKHNYTCVVQHSSLDKEIVKIIPRDGGSGVLRIGVLAAVLVIAVFVGFLIWKKKSGFTQVSQNMNPLLFDFICSSTLEAKPGENVTIWIEDNFSDNIFYGTIGYVYWLKHTVNSVPVLLGCKQVKISGETQTCYFYNDSERITMSVHGKKTSLSISAVNVSDTGLYYCSFTQLAEMKFCKSVYLQVKEGNETLIKDLDKATVFGAVSMILLSMLIFIIQKHRKKQTGAISEGHEDQDSELLHYAALQLSNKKSKRKGKHDTLEEPNVTYSSVRR